MEEKDLTYEEWINSRTSNFEYISPVSPDLPPQFPIITSTLSYDDGTKNQEMTSVTYEEMEDAKKAGFNVSIKKSLSTGDNALYESLANAEKANMRLITFNYNYYVKGYNFPCDNYICFSEGLGGLFIRDEPSYEDMKGETPDGKTMRTKYRTLMNRSDLNCILYINLKGGPGIAPPDEHKGDPVWNRRMYQQYVQAFQDNFKPSFFSFDNYPIEEKSALLYEGIKLPDSATFYSTNLGNIFINYEAYYRDLEVISSFSQCKCIDRPFWVFARSMTFLTFNPDNPKYHPVVIEQYLRFILFNALAHGAKGFLYWTYGVRKTDKIDQKESYFTALLDRRNRKTATWYYAKKINEELQKYNYIFLDGSLESVDTVNSNSSYQFQKIHASGNETILEIKLVNNDDKNNNDDADRGNGILVSKWCNKYQLYLLVVSKAALKYQNINIDVKSGLIQELTPELSGGQEGVMLSGNIYPRIMIPGGYRIFKIEKW